MDLIQEEQLTQAEENELCGAEKCQEKATEETSNVAQVYRKETHLEAQ